MSDNDSAWGAWLQKQLDQRGWRQADLVNMSAGVIRRDRVSKWINGVDKPTYQSAVIVADVLDIDASLTLAAAGFTQAEETVMNEVAITGADVREARDLNGVTQEELATMVGVEAHYIAEWENTQGALGEHEVFLLCEYAPDLFEQRAVAEDRQRELTSEWERGYESALEDMQTFVRAARRDWATEEQSLSAYRKRLDMSQSELAKAIESTGVPCTQANISRIEAGTRAVTVREALALSRVLAVPIEAILSTAASLEGGLNG